MDMLGTQPFVSFAERLSFFGGYFVRSDRKELLDCEVVLFRRLFCKECVYRRELLDCPL